MKKIPRRGKTLEKELEGKRFGKLVINRLIWVFKPRKRRKAECICDCGKISYHNIAELENGDTNSCGCLKKELNFNRCFIDRTNIRYGKLIAIKYLEDKKKWECFCDCGNRCIVIGSKLTTGETRSCGCINTAKGKDHYNWDESIPLEDKLNKRGSVKNPLYDDWRKSVFERDNYTCQISGLNGKLAAHHIFSWNKYVDLRFDINNGITILKEIHNLFHVIYGRGNNTKKQFEEFITYINEF